MSANGDGDDDGGESRPSREIAYRLFAAEFDDTTFSYSESDEERAPNYVVTPTGARINRLFAVGVLTEVEAVNDDVLRGRIVDPTGAFVSYAGQYQPDEMAFLDRASPPAFVALSGKARTFQPDDSDRVFTSVRPESMSRIDADTRDRWTVSTAEATLRRVGVMAAALRSGLTGDALHRALLDAGVEEALARGVPLALDHYGTTPAYLAASRRLALDALEVVAGERDGVRSLDRDPSEVGDGVDLAALAADLDLAGDVETAPETTPVAAGTEPPEGGEAADEVVAAASAEADAAATEPAESAEPAAGPDTTTTEASGTPTAGETTTPSAPEAAAVETDASDAEPAPEFDAEPTTEPASAADPTDASDELGDFDTDGTGDDAPLGAVESAATDTDDELGDFDTEESAQAGTTEPTSASGAEASTETAPESETDADSPPTDTDTDGMYELDDEEREEIESEFGTEFSTGSEVAPAGEAGIDVPSVEELEEELDEDLGSGMDAAEPGSETPTPGDAVDAEVETDTDATGGDSTTDGEAPADADGASADTDESPADVDLEAVAVEAMQALDDGDGASREAVVAHVVDEYGAAPDAVEDAIQSALMSGQCYEPTEDALKAI